MIGGPDYSLSDGAVAFGCSSTGCVSQNFIQVGAELEIAVNHQKIEEECEMPSTSRTKDVFPFETIVGDVEQIYR